MTDISAEGIEINIENGYWRLFNSSGAHSLTPFFHTMRGEGLLHYTPVWGEPRGLPGNVLSTEYIQAVVVGFDDRHHRWALGMHVAMQPNEKPRFVELVHWPAEDNPQFGTESHTAGRLLAEYLSCPLKLFGVKKIAQRGGMNAIHGATGPLTPHKRTDFDLRQVEAQAALVTLPLTLGDLWIGTTNDHTLVIRLPREASNKAKGEVPAYTQVTLDRNSQVIRLLPPTGLLGAFFGGQGRSIKFTDVRNVEQRHTVSLESSMEQIEGDMATDVTRTVHLFELFLTLPDESLLLLQSRHSVSSKLQRARIQMRPGEVDPQTAQFNMAYLRQHQRDQERFERLTKFADQSAAVIASFIGRGLVQTMVGEMIE